MNEKIDIPQSRKSAWCRIHLATAIVLMFVAGGFLWLNLHVFYEVTTEVYFDEISSQFSTKYIRSTGWPFKEQEAITFFASEAERISLRQTLIRDSEQSALQLLNESGITPEKQNQDQQEKIEAILRKIPMSKFGALLSNKDIWTAKALAEELTTTKVDRTNLILNMVFALTGIIGAALIFEFVMRKTRTSCR